MFVSEGGVSLSGERTVEGATHEEGRERGELLGELLPAVGWMGNCSDRRFPWPTRSTCEVVLERECGIGGMEREGERVVVVEEEVEVEEAVEEAVLLGFSPMQVFWVFSRVRRARSTLPAAPVLELELMSFFRTQVKDVRRIRCARRCRISETVAGVNPQISR